jgi:O-antigen/teichoic acid export membrane protein
VFKKLRELTVNLTVYGVGDVAVQIASFLLLPLYTIILSTTEMGAIALLLIVEQVMRVVSRWGVDASFMRFYYDCPDDRGRRELASTIFFFLLAVSGGLTVAAVAAAPFIAQPLFGGGDFTTPLRIVFLTTLFGSVSFLPFHVLRIEGRARTYVALTFANNLATLVVKLLFVVVLRMGVLGIVLADLVVAAGLAAALAPRYAALIRPVFSMRQLRACLSFGLPRVPHSFAHQVIATVDRFALSRFAPLALLGVYNIGVSLGLGLKLFLSAFETAWAPFYFREMKAPDAQRTFRTISTYVFGVLVLLVAGLAAVGRDLVRLMTAPTFHGAAAIVPWIGLSVVLQGVYLLTSIGLNITKRTIFYPVSTGLAAATAVALNLILVPRFGMIGAAWSNAAAYGVLAISGFAFSQAFYPMQYEWARLGRVAAAGVLATLAGSAILRPGIWPLWGVLLRGSTVVVVFLGTLILLGFFQPREINRARLIVRSLRQGGRAKDRAAAKAAAEEGGTLHD